jgi:hypothetical protein
MHEKARHTWPMHHERTSHQVIPHHQDAISTCDLYLQQTRRGEGEGAEMGVKRGMERREKGA